jgi:hypothetical protein
VKPILVITVDTEPDNSWQNGKSTENARFLPNFQKLCESFNFKPTYLTTYEMARDERFQAFGRDTLAREAGEIGAHPHPWSLPPFNDNQGFGGHTYLTELSEDSCRAKLSFLTDFLFDTFAVRPTSHRAGRWGFSEMVARVIAGLGYRTDCSVTPGVSWAMHRGSSAGGPDYYGFNVSPYFLDLNDIRRKGDSNLLEVPVTIFPAYRPSMLRVHHAIEKRVRLAAEAISVLVGRPYLWLRPMPTLGNGLKEMLRVVDLAMAEGLPVIEFMIHSSELIAGANPYFTTEKDIRRLNDDMGKLFEYIHSLGITGSTLSEYRQQFTGNPS